MMRKIERTANGRGIFSPGQDLIIVGHIGKAGVLEALRGRDAELRRRFANAFLSAVRSEAEEIYDITPELLRSSGATEWEYVDEGGILTALWNLSGAYRQGFSVELKKIPVRQETIEVCELFDFNPYRLKSGNCYVAAACHGMDAAAVFLKAEIPAAVVGKVDRWIARRIINDGSAAFLERPRDDAADRRRGAK